MFLSFITFKKKKPQETRTIIQLKGICAKLKVKVGFLRVDNFKQTIFRICH